MTKKLKKHMYKTITGTILFIICFFLEKICEKGIYIFFSVGTFDFSILFLLFLITYFVIGYDVVIKALKNIINMQMLDENFLMVLATVGAFFVGDYPEAVAVMVFYQIGEFFQKYAVTRARNSIKELMEICPDEAVVIRNGVEEKVSPDEVSVKEIIVVRPGEKVPLDGTIVKGNTSLDTKALTGESLPKDVFTGDFIYSGTINLNGVIEVEVSKEFSDSTVSKILELVENAQTRKGKSERFITKFAHWYTPLVVVCAVVLAVVYPLFKCVCGIETLTFGLFKPYIYRALTFLVISCPCALVISIPLSFFGGIGGASKCGILIKGSNYLENLCKARIVVTDKTGTLTEGRFEVSKVKSLSGEYSENQIIYLLKQMEKYSNHPLAKTICNYNISNESTYNVEILDICEEAGKGISGTANGQRMMAGNNKILSENNIPLPKIDETGTIIYLATEYGCIGYCILEDKIKDDSVKAVENMKKNGIKEVIMLTGDNRLTGEKVGKKIGITKVYSELLPDDKVNIFEQILSQKDKDEMIVYVGDGINDAPVLARADIGIAMGGLGSDAAIEAADIVIMDDKPSKVVTGIKIANKTVRIVRENIVFAIGVKILILIFAALGLAGMWWAIFADVGVAVIAILNAMRALYINVNEL